MASNENPMPNVECTAARRRRLQRNAILQSPLITSPSSPSHESTRCKSSISSLFISTFAPNTSSSSSAKKKGFGSATFRGLGCTSPSEVSSPAAVRSSPDWQAKRVRKKKQRKKKQATGPAVVVPDVWCSPGIGFAADAASVDCVVSRRPPAGRGRGDGERNQGERPCIVRRSNILEQISSMESPYGLETQRSGSDLLAAGHYPHLRGLRHSPGGFSEIVMLQTGYMLSGPDAYDRYRDWRLDVDNMSYEELLELGDRIGYVSTGLREEEIVRCLRKMKHSILDAFPPHLSAGVEWKCSICQLVQNEGTTFVGMAKRSIPLNVISSFTQLKISSMQEEYEADDEVGKLECGHFYHLYCIKQWLQQKNACPVCKVAAAQ